MQNEKMKRTHKGLMFGFVPVYLNMDCPEQPMVEPRFGFVIIFSVVEVVVLGLMFIGASINENYQPMFAIKVTGEINEGEKL